MHPDVSKALTNAVIALGVLRLTMIRHSANFNMFAVYRIVRQVLKADKALTEIDNILSDN